MDAATTAWWNERATRHPTTPMYRAAIEGLKRGEPVMFAEERALMGEVSGSRVLHAQCHIGTDSLSWALLGAEVTGVDLAENAVTQARLLSERLQIPATFLQGNATALPADLVGYDAVIASVGVINWIEDLDLWWANLAGTLKPGGHAVVVDCHPAAYVLDERQGKLEHVYPWFHAQVEIDEQGSYAEPDGVMENTVTREWAHSLEEILGGALRAGLVLEVYEEYRRMAWQGFPMLSRVDDAYEFEGPLGERIPLMFGLRARKPV